MSHTYEKVSSNKARISFEIPAEKFDEATQQAFLKNRKRLNVPGFRKGKAPRRMIETLYGEGVFYDDAFDALFPDAYRAAIEEYKLEPVDQPQLKNIDQMAAGQDLKFSIEVFVRPDVELGEYKNLEVEITSQKLTDEMVDDRIRQDQEKASRTIDVEDRPVEDGDTVNLDYAGTVDGVAFDGGTAQGQTLKIGSHSFIDGFEEQMIGMQIGEEKDLQVRFPDNYHSKELEGKDAVFHVKVNGIQQVEKPELDDDFAADISDFNTFEEYKADIVRQLQERIDKNNSVTLENALVQKAVENAKVDIPPVMIDDQTDYLVRNMELQMSYQGLKMEDYLRYTGMTREDLKTQQRPEAENRVKTDLVIEAIRKAEDIKPTEEDIEKAIADQAESYGEDLEDFKKNLTDSQKQYLEDSAAVQKVLDLMKSTAKVTEKKQDEKKPSEEEAAEKNDSEA
jgi:trigger factor